MREAPEETLEEAAPPSTPLTHVIPDEQTRFLLMTRHITVVLFDRCHHPLLSSRLASCLEAPPHHRRRQRLATAAIQKTAHVVLGLHDCLRRLHCFQLHCPRAMSTS